MTALNELTLHTHTSYAKDSKLRFICYGIIFMTSDKTYTLTNYFILHAQMLTAAHTFEVVAHKFNN